MEWVDLISTVGFPIALVIGFCWFIAKYVEKFTDNTKEREQSLISANEKLSAALNNVADTISKTNELNKFFGKFAKEKKPKKQNQETVKYRNGIGFKPQDAKRGSSFAKWYNDKGFFTSKQIYAVKQIVTKYAGQVVEAKIYSGEIRQISRGEWVWW